MKSLLLFLPLLFSLLILRASAQQCQESIPNCIECTQSNSTQTCNLCQDLFKPNEDSTQCLSCPQKYCLTCGSQQQVCQKCIENDYQQYLLTPASKQVTCIPCQSLQCKCQIPYFCQSCKAQTTFPDQNGQSCLQCSDPNCFRCYDNNKCRICKNGFVRNLQDQCKLCKLDNCFSCSDDNVCQTCVQGYHLTASGTCILCKFPCSYCNDDGSCKFCDFPYYNLDPSSNNQNNGQCFRPSVPNCVHHDRADNTKCKTCKQFYTYDSGTNQCVLTCNSYCLTCDSLDKNKCLTCPQNYYLTSQNKCIICASGQTTSSSTSNSCTQPKKGYFKVSQDQFDNCKHFCADCTSLDFCKELRHPYGRNLLKILEGTLLRTSGRFLSAVEVSKMNQLSKCAGNCIQCANLNSQFCITCYDGFYANDNGVCIECNSQCKTCSSSDKTICLSCYLGSILTSNTCVACDQNCQTCKSSNQLSVCTSCKNGWSLNLDSNQCEQNCPDNCLVCQSSTNCIKCTTGYVTYPSDASKTSYICLPCISNCRVCMEQKPQICIQCGQGFYTLTGQTCIQLTFQFCKSGNQQQCFECYEGYQLFDRLTCQRVCNYPCATCLSSDSSTCTSCIAGYYYQDISKSCVKDFSCHHDCNICPFGNSLLYGDCVQCQAQASHCQRCDASAPATCFSCNAGYYLNSLSKCSSCPLQCRQCFSQQKCSSCEQGYFLNTNYYTCQKCSSEVACQTCDYQSTFCTSCKSGYTLNGYKCEKDESMYIDLTLSTSLQNFNQKYYVDFVKYYSQLLYPGTSDFYVFTLKQLKSVGSSQTQIIFTLAYTFAKDQNTADQKLKLKYDSLIANDFIIINDLTINSFKVHHLGDYTVIYDNFCTAFKENCIICQFKTQNCLKCPTGFTLNQNLGNGYCLSCQASNCQKCIDVADICDVCNQRYYLDKTPGPVCKPCQDTKCLTCPTASTCSKCQSGYQIDQNLNCVLCAITGCIQQGISMSLTMSQSLNDFNSNYQDDFELYFSSLLGYSNSDSFNTISLKSLSSQTTEISFTLPYDFALDQNKADQKLKIFYDAIFGNDFTILTDLLILQFKGKHLGKYTNVRENFCTIQVASCQLCQFKTSKCARCNPGKSVNQNHQCLSCDVKKCQFCLNADDICDYCIQGYYLVSTVSPPICQKCDVSDCLICSEKGLCDQCQSGFIINDFKTACINCGLANCKQCLSQTYCSTCNDGYNLNYFRGQCFICSIPHCKTCQSLTYCDECDSSLNYFLNEDNGQCEACDLVGCLTCLTKTVCQTCKNKYSLNQQTGLCVQCNVDFCFNGCSIPNKCSDCANKHTHIVNPSDQDGQHPYICIPCNVQNCIYCVWQDFCYFCDTSKVKTLSPTVYGDKCVSCKVNRCAICSSADVCAVCLYPFVLHEKKNICVVCVMDNCQECSKPGICQTCNDGYAPSSTGACVKCPQQCQTCLSNGKCLTCASPQYNYLTSQNSSSLGECFKNTIGRCNTHNRTNHSRCISCDDPYIKSQDESECITPCSSNCKTCKNDDVSNCLTCYDQNFLDGTKCSLCQMGCKNCSSSNKCNIALDGFFVNQEGVVIPCRKQCKKCSSVKDCDELFDTDGKAIFNGQDKQSRLLICTGNCKLCQNTQKCIECREGFYLVSSEKQKKREGICYPCNPLCKTCDSSNPDICSSCPDNYFLSSKTCKACDDNCLTCKSHTQSKICRSCVIDRWLDKSTNTCVVGCPLNCLSCTNQKDCFTCNTGYTTLLDQDTESQTFNQIICTPCVVSCRLCAPNEPSNCIFCGDGFYMYQGECISCPDNCKTCSERSCTTCLDNYQLVVSNSQTNEKICAKACDLPCWQCTIGKPSQCTSCVAGYSLNGNKCIPKLSCQPLCFVCAPGYVLDNGACLACTTTNCQKCLVNKLQTCLFCVSGYYLDDKICKSCPSQCKQCFSDQECTSCIDGYVLQNKQNKRGFKCNKCDQKCKTCIDNENKCTSCVDGYQLKGWKCQQNFKVQMKHTFDCTVKQFNKRNRIVMFVFLKILGIIDPDKFSYYSIKPGSTNVVSTAILPGGSGTSTAWQSFVKMQEAALAGTLGGLKVTASSIEVKGGYVSGPLSASSLGIILGVSIPLGILLIVGIAVLVYFKSKDSQDKYTSYDGTGTDRENVAVTGYALTKNRIQYEDNSMI